jgi:hypothetical protein
MSLNQISQPNTYLPPVEFNEAKINNLTTGVQLFPCVFASDATATPDQRISMFADGTNCGLKLGTNVPGAGAYLQFSNPNTDIDLRLGVSNTDQCFLLSKTDLNVVDENFNLSLSLNKTPGNGVTIQNPNITNYIPSALNAYTEITTANIPLTGFTTGDTVRVSCTRIGNAVVLNISNVNGTGDGGVVSTTSALQIPFRPLVAVECCIPTASNNAVLTVGNVTILPSGIIEFEPASGALFGNTANNGWNKFSICYNLS